MRVPVSWPGSKMPSSPASAIDHSLLRRRAGADTFRVSRARADTKSLRFRQVHPIAALGGESRPWAGRRVTTRRHTTYQSTETYGRQHSFRTPRVLI